MDRFRFKFEKGEWKEFIEVPTVDGDVKDAWVHCMITEVPVNVLLDEWENLINELSGKEVELMKVMQEYRQKEFNIWFVDDIDFKESLLNKW